MALNTEKNSYTLLFAIGLVVIVGTLLASVDASLKEKIKVNKVLEKQQNILGRTEAVAAAEYFGNILCGQRLKVMHSIYSALDWGWPAHSLMYVYTRMHACGHARMCACTR